MSSYDARGLKIGIGHHPRGSIHGGGLHRGRIKLLPRRQWWMKTWRRKQRQIDRVWFHGPLPPPRHLILILWVAAAIIEATQMEGDRGAEAEWRRHQRVIERTNGQVV
ncbi:hypothetical protein SEVIR_3G088401v4 [Setaria viridis]